MAARSAPSPSLWMTITRTRRPRRPSTMPTGCSCSAEAGKHRAARQGRQAPCDEWMKRQLSSVSTEHGHYSEIFIHWPMGSGVGTPDSRSLLDAGVLDASRGLSGHQDAHRSGHPGYRSHRDHHRAQGGRMNLSLGRLLVTGLLSVLCVVCHRTDVGSFASRSTLGAGRCRQSLRGTAENAQCAAQAGHDRGGTKGRFSRRPRTSASAWMRP